MTTYERMQHIIGQDRAIQSLLSALRADRVHHAWVFHGPPGVGKWTTAKAFGLTLLGSPQPQQRPVAMGAGDGDTPSEPASGARVDSDPDLHEVTKELAAFSRDDEVRRRKQIVIPVDVIREFVTEPAFRSSQRAGTPGRASKVFLIDEAELLGVIAQNVLLKTLEEPPAGTILILVTAHEDRLAPTIRSRCQRVAFGALDSAAMEQWMKRSGVSVSPEQRAWLERFAQGSPGLALLAITHGIYEWYLTIAPMLADLRAGGFPADLGSALSGFVEEFAVSWVKDHENASKDAANKAACRFVFMVLAAELRDRLRRAALGGGEGLDDALRGLDLIRNAERQLQANVNPALLMDNMVIQMADSVGRSMAPGR